MNTKHTPGPWHYTRNHPNAIPAFNVFDSKGMMVGYLGHTATPGQAEANARLIVTAPDLLTALTNLCNWCESLDLDGSGYIADSVARARTVIAKATGDEP